MRFEKCLEDEECKSETLLTLEKTLASVDEDGNVDGGVVVEAKREKKGFESTKTADEGDYEIVVSEPPLNIERLKSVGTIARTFEIWSFVVAFVFRRVFIGVKWSYKGGTPKRSAWRDSSDWRTGCDSVCSDSDRPSSRLVSSSPLVSMC